jgi:hypothetical protein
VAAGVGEAAGEVALVADALGGRPHAPERAQQPGGQRPAHQRADCQHGGAGRDQDVAQQPQRSLEVTQVTGEDQVALVVVLGLDVEGGGFRRALAGRLAGARPALRHEDDRLAGAHVDAHPVHRQRLAEPVPLGRDGVGLAVGGHRRQRALAQAGRVRQDVLEVLELLRVVADAHPVVDVRQPAGLVLQGPLDAPDVGVTGRPADQLRVLLGLALEGAHLLAVQARADVGVDAQPERGQRQGEQPHVGEDQAGAEAHRPASGSSRST